MLKTARDGTDLWESWSGLGGSCEGQGMQSLSAQMRY